MSKFAAPAASEKRVCISQPLKERRVTIDLQRVLGAFIPGGQREESRRLNLAGMRDEHDAVAVPDAQPAQHRAMVLEWLAPHAGQRQPAVMRGFGRRHHWTAIA